ncbi:MAG: hypothetical protein ABIR08_08960 [Sphingomonas sp.]
MAIAAVLGTIVVGVAVALLVVPADQPKPAAPTATATIKIAPTPQPEPTASAPTLDTSARTSVTTRRHGTPHPAPTIAPDPDAGTVVTTNSW